MKRCTQLISLLMALALAFALAACGSGSTGAAAPAEGSAPAVSQAAAPAGEGKQIAARSYFYNGHTVNVTMDMSDDWSVEFASGALYIYDGPYSESREAVGYGYLESKWEYDQTIAEHRSYDSFSLNDGAMKVTEEDGGNRYVFPVGDHVYFMIYVNPGVDAESVYERVDVALDPYSEDSDLDYLVLVNKLNPLPEGWEEKLETVHMTNSVGDDVEVEKQTYEAYLRLKEELEQDGVYVDLDSGRRSVAEQQDIMDRFTKEYGADYAAKTVAEPGYSEHHTGLALDLYLIVDGKDVTKNEDLMKYPELWAKIHCKLAKHGFILRLLPDKEQLTGYGYEPWHIRYVGNVDAAKEMFANGEVLESYLGEVEDPEMEMDYGSSRLYTKEELQEAAVQVKCDFAKWDGCVMHSLRYAGDECNSEENLKWLNSLKEGANYTQVVEFLGSYRSPVDEEKAGAWDPGTEYEDYQWWLARSEDSGWEIVTMGY